jgi:hypothetical protein
MKKEVFYLQQPQADPYLTKLARKVLMNQLRN